MVSILREFQIAPVFRKVARRANQIDIAVPFWGNGAIKALSLTKGQPVRIVCNLDLPGCNPAVIAAIRELGIMVKTHPRLHAKLYVTPGLAIVGSSNVSTNGMTDEGTAAAGWIEANVTSDAPAFVADVQCLFEEIWSQATTVTAVAVKRAMANRPPPTPRSVRSTTLLAACREKPTAFNTVFVASYGDDLSKEARRELTTIRTGAAPSRPGISWSDFQKAEGYQFGTIPEGAWLLGLDCRRDKGPKYTGCSRATGLQYPIPGQTILDVVLPGQVILDGRTFRISSAEKAQLVGIAAKLLRKGLTSLPQAIKMIDRRIITGKLTGM